MSKRLLSTIDFASLRVAYIVRFNGFWTLDTRDQTPINEIKANTKLLFGCMLVVVCVFVCAYSQRINFNGLCDVWLFSVHSNSFWQCLFCFVFLRYMFDNEMTTLVYRLLYNSIMSLIFSKRIELNPHQLNYYCIIKIPFNRKRRKVASSQTQTRTHVSSLKFQ